MDLAKFYVTSTRRGNSGIIEPGKAHSCSQCSQPYKAIADFMVNEDPAAVIGVDENSAVPVLEGQYAHLSAHETAVKMIWMWIMIIAR